MLYFITSTRLRRANHGHIWRRYSQLWTALRATILALCPLQGMGVASPSVTVRRTTTTIPKGFMPNTLLTSADLKHVAFVERQTTQRVRVVRDGKAGAFYQKIDLRDFRMSREGRVAYTAQKGNKTVIVVDGRESSPYDEVLTGSVRFSEVGNHLFYIARRGMEKFAVIDGHEQTSYANIFIYQDRPIFSPNGRRFAYMAQKDNLWRVVTEIGEQSGYTAVSSMTFSPDSQQLVYIASQGNSNVLVTNGNSGVSFPSISELTFSPNSQRLAYLIEDTGEKYRVVVDGVVGAPLQKRLGSPLIFSPDSRRLAYVMTNVISNEETMRLSVDGVEGSNYRIVKNVAFSPDSRHIAFFATRKIGPKFDCLVVRDGREGRPFHYSDLITQPAPLFSPDSQRLTYAAVYGSQRHVVVNGKTGKDYSDIRHLKFSSDSRHVVYFISQGKGRDFLVLNGHAIRMANAPFKDCVFTGPHTLMFIAVRNRRLSRVTLNMPR